MGVETWAHAPQLLTDVDRYLAQRRSKMWKQYQVVLEQQQREADSLAGPAKGEGAREAVLPPVPPAGGVRVNARDRVRRQGSMEAPVPAREEDLG